MHRSLVRPLLFAAGLLTGCATHPFLQAGDAKSAAVTYSGNLDEATTVARRHCAEFARDARFVTANIDTAYFDCVGP